MSITARFLAPLLLLPTLGLNAQTPERKPEQEPPPPTTAELFKRAQDKAARDLEGHKRDE